MALDPFITVEELSDKIGRDVSSDPGATLAVNAACAVCRTVAEQDFSSVTETVTIDGTGTDVLVLDRVPVTRITSVTVGDNLDTTYVSSKGMLFKQVGVWPMGRRNVSVKYQSGYSEIPDDIRLVALELAQRIVIQGPALAETNGDVSIRYAVTADDLTANELRILRKHRGR